MAGNTFIPYLVGYPRIGPDRELKKALEARWSGRITPADFQRRIEELRALHLQEQRDLIGHATDDYFLYDETVETALMFGAAPEWARHSQPFETLTAVTRGTPDHEAWEMTKWFDTNYHFVVPELDSSAPRFEPFPWREPIEGTTWVVLGPYSLVKLAKIRGANHHTAGRYARALWSWLVEAGGGSRFAVQLDEPHLGLTGDADPSLVASAYQEIPRELGALVSVQFGRPSPSTVAFLGARGCSVQVSARHLAEYASVLDSQPELFVSVLEARSVWPDDPEPVWEAIESVEERAVRLAPSTSLIFLPYTIEGEDLPAGFQFAREKAATLRRWAEAFSESRIPDFTPVQVPEFAEIGAPVLREARLRRRKAQTDLSIPELPTTTTGSLPQTADVRRLRVQLNRGAIDQEAYDRAIDHHIRDAIAWQERVGLDVLVHGEFERSDMVEYFAERMDGFLTTHNGWVLSYGSRCMRPPILAGPPSIDQPMTVREWKVAQEATTKPVKGMLTGPVTITNWSFRPPGVSDDRLFWAVAQPIAQEVGFLVQAGARVIQIDEPAVRERWPLPTPDAEELREVYSRGVRAALNRVFDAPSRVQLHTHMCYGDFGDIVALWDSAGVDVASIEFSRSKDPSYINSFYALFDDGHLRIGPGVFDVHSPHSPGAATMEERLEYFLRFMDETDVWINPDCGLKTRSWDEIEVQLADMVKAAEALRAQHEV